MRSARLKSILTLLLVAAVCFAMVFSAFFIAFEADHDCQGDGCTVCAQIASCEYIIRNVGLALIAVSAVFAAVYTAVSVLPRVCRTVEKSTLIALKTELLN